MKSKQKQTNKEDLLPLGDLNISGTATFDPIEQLLLKLWPGTIVKMIGERCEPLEAFHGGMNECIDW